MAKRGFFAEMNHQAQQAEKRRRQQEAAAVRAHASAVRAAETARRKAQNARAAAARASAAEQKAAERVAAQLYAEARAAEVNSMNVDLANAYDEIDGLLAATLEVDDYVDLESLKVTSVEHPPFDPGQLAVPAEPDAGTGLPAAAGTCSPAGADRAVRCVRQEEAPGGGGAGRGDHRQQCAEVAGALPEDVRRLRGRAGPARAGRGAARQGPRRGARPATTSECAQREAEAQQRNEELTKFINDLAFDVRDAIEEYVGIVLSNSVYPDAFPVELRPHVRPRHPRADADGVRPGTGGVPSVKEYRYVKAKDEIVADAAPGEGAEGPVRQRRVRRWRCARCTRCSRPTVPARSSPSR